MPGTHPSQQGARSAGTEPRAVHQLGLPGPLHPSRAQQAVGVSPLCPCISKDTPVGVSRVVQTQTRGSLPGPGGSPSLRSRPLGVLVTPEKTKGESHRGLSHSSGACVLPLSYPGVQNPKFSLSVLRRPRNSHCPPLSSLTPGAAGCLVGPCGLAELGSYKWGATGNRVTGTPDLLVTLASEAL